MSGHEVVAVDDLRHGHRAAVHPAASFTRGDLLDRGWLADLLREWPVEAAVHLAAEALIDDSVRDPGRYFQVNVSGGLNLLDALVQTGVRRLVFSSTAAVYGDPAHLPIDEDAPCQPVNAYGESKLAFERMLAWYHRAHDLRYVTLRYFNAAGATERYGEWHQPETHLIPVVFAVALRQRSALRLFGTDYDTPDGSCIRDYVHVVDIARAHLLALDKLDALGSAVFNLGNSTGYSNRQVIDAVQRITDCHILVEPSARRPGDPARLVASADRIRQQLGWQPRIPDLETIVAQAWDWRRRHPDGYRA